MKNIFFCPDTIASTLQEWLDAQSYTQIVWLTDTHTHKYCLPILERSSSDIVVEVPTGEIHKNIATCQHIWQAMTQANIDRKALVINLGGGVIGDMGGFCAATYKRGIDFVQVPTTLLAQVDASIGGKLGIDFEGYKNQIGLFVEPKAVFIDVQFLNTLPERQMRSGFAEIIKHCLIADKDMWSALLENSNWKTQNWQELVQHSIEIKYQIVSKDFEEKNVRKLLNFGHTIGHAIESYFLDTTASLLHGEAIAWGIVAETYISYQKGFLLQEDFLEIQDFITKIFAPKPVLDERAKQKIAALTLQDKKNEQGKRYFTLLAEIGRGIFEEKVEEYDIYEALEKI